MRIYTLASVGSLILLSTECLAFASANAPLVRKDRDRNGDIVLNGPVRVPNGDTPNSMEKKDEPSSTTTSTTTATSPTAFSTAPIISTTPIGEDRPQQTGMITMELIVDSTKQQSAGWPMVRATIDGNGSKQPINLAVSLHSPETWISADSPVVCPNTECPFFTDSQRQDVNFSYDGPLGGLDIKAKGDHRKLRLTSSGSTPQWDIPDFTMGVAWNQWPEKSPSSPELEKLKPADGILGLGPKSTFLSRVMSSPQTSLGLYLGKESGNLVIGGYFRKKGKGKFQAMDAGNTGELKVGVKKISLKDGKEVGKEVDAILDSTYYGIRLPKGMLQELVKEAGDGWGFDERNGKAIFTNGKPEKLPTFVFDVNGLPVEIPSDAYLTPLDQPAFTTTPRSRGKRRRNGGRLTKRQDDNRIVLGRPFFHSTYLVIDQSSNKLHVAQADTSPNLDLGQPEPITTLNNPTSNDDENQNNPDEDDNDSPDTQTPTTPSTPKSSKKSSNLPAIVGGAVGGVLLLAVILGLWFWLRRRRNSRKRHHEPEMSSLAPAAAQTENARLMEGYSMSATTSRGPTPLPFPPNAQQPQSRYIDDDDDDLDEVPAMRTVSGGVVGVSGVARHTSSRGLVRNISVTSTVTDDSEIERTNEERERERNIPRLPIYRGVREDGSAL